MEKLLYGAAYYDEYMPCERLEKDIEMMKAAGINTVRIAESTWSTCEPQPGVFDFSHVERVLDAMEEAGISVIIGTPTYAVPAWLAKAYPDVIAETTKGKGIYGARQIMDITHPAYRFYGERVIRKLMECSAHRACVIGFQIDNETKYYDAAGPNIQRSFVKYLREKFQDNLEAMNREFGLDYWSNRIDSWEDFPDVRGTINGSLGGEFDKFRRTLVEEFFAWQAGIVSEYKRKDQFITHNFDFEWRGYSYGVQPMVNHFQAAKNLTVAGVDIYHPTQDMLTGEEIAFCGDIARSLKQDNYLVMETQAQGFPGWVPYEGQLRLQAYSHIASGANSVMYWHWHSIHNSFETYWKGLLSHDFLENDTYREAKRIGREFRELGSHLVNLKKKNQIAVLVSNEALTALEWFGIDADAGGTGKTRYNDIVRWLYQELYRMNAECDFVCPDTEGLEAYKMLVVPALYAASDELLKRLEAYVEQGGCLVASFKTGFANEHIKVSHELQPHILHKAFGAQYHQFTFPGNTKLKSTCFELSGEEKAEVFMELLETAGAETLVSYDHSNWGKYSAVTRNHYGKGTAYYLGCKLPEKLLRDIYRSAMEEAGIYLEKENQFPVIVRKGKNTLGKTVTFYLNYSAQPETGIYQGNPGRYLLKGDETQTRETIKPGEKVFLAPWGVAVTEA